MQYIQLPIKTTRAVRVKANHTPFSYVSLLIITTELPQRPQSPDPCSLEHIFDRCLFGYGSR